MPKPVLSDSLFNADDVATAILNKANLQVTNNDLGVTSIATPLNNGTMTVDNDRTKMFHFNGFVFLQLRCSKNGTVTSGETIATIASTEYYPSYLVLFNSITLSGDAGDRVEIDTDGTIKIHNPNNTGDSFFRVNGNLFYRN